MPAQQQHHSFVVRLRVVRRAEAATADILQVVGCALQDMLQYILLSHLRDALLPWRLADDDNWVAQPCQQRGVNLPGVLQQCLVPAQRGS